MTLPFFVDPSDGHDVFDGRSVFVHRNKESVCQADKPADQGTGLHDLAVIDTNKLLIAADPDYTCVGHREVGGRPRSHGDPRPCDCFAPDLTFVE
jgi:hypothetical protein